MLMVHNTFKGRKEKFEPLQEGKVGMYICGPTVYDHSHIGHLRPLVVYDAVRRYFQYLGNEVTMIVNVTDVDDKMINRANELGVDIKELADKYTKEYLELSDRLGVISADHYPRATGHIPEMIALIKKLIEKGIAYQGGGDVYFSVNDFPGYGKLSKRSPEELLEGSRIEPGEGKKNPLDFALWKAKKEGEPSWESPWGEGRPGWHIECSAMSTKYLGERFDIHGGALDLIFPHHENEIAQSEAANGAGFAKYWLHNGFITREGQKMSKSLGNFITANDVLKSHAPMVVRLWFLSHHYRSPLDFSEKGLDAAREAYNRLDEFRVLMTKAYETAGLKDTRKQEPGEVVEDLQAEFREAMDNDFNTAGAVGVLFELVKEGNVFLRECAKKGSLDKADGSRIGEYLALFNEITGILGIFQKVAEIPAEVLEKIQQREERRAEKNWSEADRIRDELAKQGVVLEDNPLLGTVARRSI